MTLPVDPYLMTRDDMLVCNCARCARLLLSPRMEAVPWHILTKIWTGRPPQFLYRRVNDRPYCRVCFWKRLQYPSLPDRLLNVI